MNRTLLFAGAGALGAIVITSVVLAGLLVPIPSPRGSSDPFKGYSAGTSDEVAVVIPTFTSAAYSLDGFYAFYVDPSDVSHLSVRPSDLYKVGTQAVWGDTYGLYHFLAANPDVSGNFTYLTDPQVDNGSLFENGVRQFRAVVLGHEEYVTKSEYFQFQAFVATGGVVIATSANSFWAEVNYSKTTGVETFVIGHGWSFDGIHATYSSVHPFEAKNINWTGATYCCKNTNLVASPSEANPIGAALHSAFGTSVFQTHTPQEEDYLRNFTRTSVIATWSTPGVFTYAHRYGSGVFVGFGGFEPSLILSDTSTQQFLRFTLNSTYFGV